MFSFKGNSGTNVLSNKPVTFLDGIGPVYGGRLNSAGYMTAGQILDKFQSFGGNQQQFQSWLQSICAANARWSLACYQCLRRYSNVNETNNCDFTFTHSNLPPKPTCTTVPEEKQTKTKYSTTFSFQNVQTGAPLHKSQEYYSFKPEEKTREDEKQKEIDSLKYIIQDKNDVINKYKLQLKQTCEEKDEVINSKQKTIDYLRMLIKEKDEILDRYNTKNQFISEENKKETDDKLSDYQCKIDSLKEIIKEKDEILDRYKMENKFISEENKKEINDKLSDYECEIDSLKEIIKEKDELIDEYKLERKYLCDELMFLKMNETKSMN